MFISSNPNVLYAAALAVPACDPYFNDVERLSNFEQPNGSQTFVDESGNGLANWIVLNGEPAPVSTSAESAFGTSSVYFDGVVTRRLVGNLTSNLVFQGNDWCYECFAKVETSSNYGNIFSRWGAGATGNKNFFFGEYNQQMVFAYYNGLTFTQALSAVLDMQSDFNHFAWVRNGATVTMYFNGVSVATHNIGAYVFPDANTINFLMGSDGDNVHAFNGWVNGSRLTIGQPRYTAPFTPPAEPFPDVQC
jgi:hypothetical protein